MKSLSKLTMRSLWDSRLKAIGEDYHNIKSYKILAQRFLKDFFSFKLSSADFEEVLAEYQNQTQKKDCPITEDAFYYYICQEYLELESLPRDKLTDLYISATEDLQLIEQELECLKSKKEALNRKKSKHTYLEGDDRYYLKLIEHYEQKNITARNEIVIFLTKDINRKSLELSARSRIANSLSWLFHSNAPYSYAAKGILGYKKFSFSIDNVFDIEHNFLDLSLRECKELTCTYNNDKKDFIK